MHDDHDAPHERSGSGPGNGETHAQRAAEHFRRGQLPEAEAELRKAIADDPDRGDWRFNLGLTLEAAGRLDDALHAFREALRRMPRRVEAQLAEGSLLVRLGRYEEAIKPLAAARGLDPRCEPAWAKAIEALSNLGRFEEAETTYYLAQQALERMPLCLVAMGDLQLALGRHEKSAWCYREALSQAPELPRLRAKLARALAEGGSQDAAARLFVEELRINPGDVETLLDCGDLLAAMRRGGEALEKYRRAVELAPNHATPRARLGVLLGALGRNDRARAELETAYALDPDAPLLRLSLASVLHALGEPGPALRLLREDVARRRDWSSPAAALELARIADLFASAGEPSDAAIVLERVAAARPDDVGILRKLMATAFAAGMSRFASGVARRLKRLDPTARPAIEHNLILDAIERRRLRLAYARLQRALRAHPGDLGLRRLRATWWLTRLRSLSTR